MKTIQEIYEALKRMPELVEQYREWGPAQYNDHAKVSGAEVVDALEAIEDLGLLSRGVVDDKRRDPRARLDDALGGHYSRDLQLFASGVLVIVEAIDRLRPAQEAEHEEEEPTGMDDPRIANREGKIVIEREGRRQVLDAGQDVERGDVFIVDRPHGDDRFDYTCGFMFCRCGQ